MTAIKEVGWGQGGSLKKEFQTSTLLMSASDECPEDFMLSRGSKA